MFVVNFLLSFHVISSVVLYFVVLIEKEICTYINDWIAKVKEGDDRPVENQRILRTWRQFLHTRRHRHQPFNNDTSTKLKKYNKIQNSLPTYKIADTTRPQCYLHVSKVQTKKKLAQPFKVIRQCGSLS